jgi:trimeric autotransporter adhesin
MPTHLDYAVLSATAYNAARGPDNKLTLTNWSEVAVVPTSSVGFEAQAYRNGTDVVIAFTGTNFFSSYADPNGVLGFDWGRAFGTGNDFLFGNIAVLGIGGQQLIEAALFYRKVKTENPGANITFTGHSLGGGIASVMAVWFDRQATTFAEAPFRNAAVNPFMVSKAISALEEIAPLDSALKATMQNSLSEFESRQAQVTHYAIPGEIVEQARAIFPAVVGSPHIVLAGDTAGIPAATLHSITLHAALLMSLKFQDDVTRLPGLLQAILDANLYARPAEGNQKDFLTGLLNDQIKMGIGYNNPQGQLALFATDIARLTKVGTVKIDAINKGLIATAMEYYYFLQSGNTNEFFHDVIGGIKFDLNEIGANNEHRGRNKLIAAVRESFDPDGYMRFLRPTTWYFQSGSDALTATSSDSANTAMIGGIDGDTLESGTGNDFLYGGAGVDSLKGGEGIDFLHGGIGDDTLTGGQGNDFLSGDEGIDTYKYTTGDGRDTIRDIYGLGSILFDGQAINGGNTKQHLKQEILLVRVDYIRTQSRDLSLRSGF